MPNKKYSTFEEAVWRAVEKIPRGKVASYGEIASLIGRPGAARAVGNALNKNPHLVTVPCHRVIRSGGSVGGYGGPGETKRKIELLEAEGVEVVGGMIDLKRSGWRNASR